MLVAFETMVFLSTYARGIYGRRSEDVEGITMPSVGL